MFSRQLALPAAFGVIAAAVLIFGMSAQGGTRLQQVVSCATGGPNLLASATLSADLTCTGTSSPAIWIGANGVTLNLNGHTITGDGGNNQYCIYNPGWANVSIVGGTLTNCLRGVVDDGAHAVIKNLTINEGVSPMDIGVELDYATNARVVNVTVLNAEAQGFYVDDGAQNSVTGSTVTNTNGATLDQYYVTGESNSTLNGNTATDNSGNATGFHEYRSSGTTYSGNKASGGTDGFLIQCDALGVPLVSSNTASNEANDGFSFLTCYQGNVRPQSDFLTVTGNTASGNGNWGFEESLTPEFNSVWTNNLAQNNDAGGFSFYEPGGYTITGNTAKGNDGDGFYFGNPSASYPPNALAKNTATGNSGYGFDSGNVGLPGTNLKASGNQAGDCYIVAGC